MAFALNDIDTVNPHWTAALLFVLAAVVAITLAWWFFGSDN
ncbi:hypothetical protein O4220_11710 [Rhodococcus ruber]|uniref:Uncharacterized protein n=1 Tax=Rhodococcus ruber TaxID=1830 RepID=A0ABT4MDY3_9NOCA|nr:hypothetical protein [Rhodococcus ruber]MCZ4519182.1 hypothetical protein [Rhodococcus ruber]